MDDSGQVNTLLLLVSGALVLLMTPGVAFFYGGLVRAKSVVSMMMLSLGAMGLVGVLWVLFGYSMAFGKPLIPGWLGDPFADWGLQSFLGMDGSGALHPDANGLAFAAFQGSFAILAIALISGGIADRARFGGWMLFVAIFVVVVYFPVAYWVFNLKDGWGPALGVNDFAGGTAIHINAGAAALALALVLGRRIGFAKGAHKPHSVPLVLLGAALLWFGWFGFNAGSAAAVDGTAVLAFINTIAAPAAGIVGWLVVEKLKDGKPTSIGAASGAISGLVAVTPGCNILTPWWALVLGLVAGALCAWAVELKYRWGFDDSLDVVGIHLIGGLFGTLYIGIFGQGIGLLDTGSLHQLGVQALASVVVLVCSFVAAYAIGWVVEKTIGFRVRSEDELAGVDLALHGESGYVMADGGVSDDPVTEPDYALTH
ncbi:ammonium transporter [Microbacterium gorillae]|uniref:ammonium transporter n=1 Tax=Microbacterium gorillae TaxID=1231063 RepID=UPI0006940562|nr:ammonium transporter [Microbacterium gorillae]